MPNIIHFSKKDPKFYSIDYDTTNLQDGMFARWFKALILWGSCDREFEQDDIPLGTNLLVQFIFFCKPIQANVEIANGQNDPIGFYIDVPEKYFKELCTVVTDALFAEKLEQSDILHASRALANLSNHIRINTYNFRGYATDDLPFQVIFTQNEPQKIWKYFAVELKTEGYDTDEYIEKALI